MKEKLFCNGNCGRAVGTISANVITAKMREGYWCETCSKILAEKQYANSGIKKEDAIDAMRKFSDMTNYSKNLEGKRYGT